MDDAISSTQRTTLDWVVFGLCAGLAVLAVAVALLQIVAFAQTDRVPAQLLQWGLLVLGIAGLAAVPFSVVALCAWRGVAALWATLFLMLPWAAVGVLWILVSDYDWIIGAVPAAVAGLAILRAVAVHRTPKLNTR